MDFLSGLLKKWNKISLVQRIIIGLIIGILLAVLIPEQTRFVTIFGSLFVGALRAIAPLLVFFLVMSAIAQHKSGQETNMKSIIILYLVGTVISGLVAVAGSFLFPVTVTLGDSVSNIKPPQGLVEVLKNLLLNIVDNPIEALSTANYIGILSWAILLGVALKNSKETTKNLIANFSDALTKLVKWVINFAPLGVMGLVFNAIVANGLSALQNYGKLVLLLLGCMAFVAFVTNPLIVFLSVRKNPYPLVFKCLKKSGITAFFTRSSAANIPINMNLCEELELNKDTYSVSIPLGATINMSGAAVTITVMTLAAAHTLGITVDIYTAVILSIIAAISACGTSGVAGGSILLIPLAASLFGIPNAVAMQVVGVGFIIGVIQDSCETALNSSTDVLFTATAEFAKKRRQGEDQNLELV
ncbi:serine/threonine transporter SstT [Halanaerobium salsuginis]|uniref:Serine/threonine transporter SstT n=1 Tax=Halanaerobium salsuginis TaxID=29563 RepID=A0A1I4KA39_9FIRM|nr:serine/threonine transporter SstT [Halanaerobium salsuginis]SFL75423.1 serine/threonine transporter [Halanaerobium salsuginis]